MTPLRETPLSFWTYTPELFRESEARIVPTAFCLQRVAGRSSAWAGQGAVFGAFAKMLGGRN